MSETATGAQTGQTNEQTVSKTELDKVQATNAELSRNLESLKGQLLDTDYLNYLADKKAGRNTPAPSNANVPNVNSNIGSLTLAQLQQVVAQEVRSNIENTMKPVYGRINELGAKLEVEDVRKAHADFDEYKDQIVSILESTPNTELSIEQAYEIAKGRAAGKESKATEEVVAPKQNEKPGGTVPLAGESAQRHKDSNAAGQAAWNEVRGRYGLSGDTI